jgi:uncharacterized membrane protein (TIGR02234 family)
MTEAAAPGSSRPRDRAYAPTVLLGLAGAGGAAVAGARTWATSRGDAAGIKVEAAVSGADSQPLVTALALVALAAWGVVLVTRGALLRRAVAVVGLLAAAGALVAVVLGFSSVQDDALDAAVARGATGDTFVTSLTAWYYLGGVGAALAAAAFVVAVIRSPRWPAMGARYDAPAARADAVRSGEPAAGEPRAGEPRAGGGEPGAAQSEPRGEDMWRALDEGRDPTA